MGYKGKTLVLKAISKLNQRIKRLGIDVKEIQQHKIYDIFPLKAFKSRLFAGFLKAI